jgi:4-alpha-glucanotransferase
VTDAAASPGPLTGRASGILLHLSSLPGPGSSGTLGEAACRFVDFLVAAGFSYWQMLPLGSTDRYGSPYQAASAFAGDPALLAPNPESPPLAGAGIRELVLGSEFADFLDATHHWLDDYALYQVIRSHHPDCGWHQWPEPLRRRDPKALVAVRRDHADACRAVQIEQFLFDRQWRALRRYAADRGVRLIGDLPLFVAHGSADVWCHPDQFLLDDSGQQLTVAGVPPDYFSATGQWWGNPHYRWEAMARDGFRWWRQRLNHLAWQFDLVRFDHFRGLEACWEIPAGATSAAAGRWVPGPGSRLLDALAREHWPLPLIAEDLGVITPAVEELRDRYGLPGMKILQFAFDSDASNPYLPHNHRPNAVVYTGTHDNDTTLGWFGGLAVAQQQHVLAYLGHPADPMPWPLIRAAFASAARLTIIPMQDLLALGSARRMNTPGTCGGNNWRFRFAWEEVPDHLAAHLRELNSHHARAPIALRP